MHEDLLKLAISSPRPASEEARHPVDRHVGVQIRLGRKAMGMSQEGLAERLGLTFQQVQKYEPGANRVSASRLWEISRALKSNISYFFDGLGEESKPDDLVAQTELQDFLFTEEGLELAGSFPRVPSPRVRRRILELVKALAEPDHS